MVNEVGRTTIGLMKGTTFVTFVTFVLFVTPYRRDVVTSYRRDVGNSMKGWPFIEPTMP